MCPLTDRADPKCPDYFFREKHVCWLPVSPENAVECARYRFTKYPPGVATTTVFFEEQGDVYQKTTPGGDCFNPVKTHLY